MIPFNVPNPNWLQIRESPDCQPLFEKKKKKSKQAMVAEMPVFTIALRIIIQIMKILEFPSWLGGNDSD